MIIYTYMKYIYMIYFERYKFDLNIWYLFRKTRLDANIMPSAVMIICKLMVLFYLQISNILLSL